MYIFIYKVEKIDQHKLMIYLAKLARATQLNDSFGRLLLNGGIKHVYSRNYREKERELELKQTKGKSFSFSEPREKERKEKTSNQYI
jgi:hypothetical protein